jgi:hypothetical protein
VRPTGERNTKHQTPNTREAPSSKFQARSAGRGLELGTWDFFDVWSLVFGVWRWGVLWSRVAEPRLNAAVLFGASAVAPRRRIVCLAAVRGLKPTAYHRCLAPRDRRECPNSKTIREVVLAMGLMEAKKLDEILNIRRLTEGGYVEGVSAGG